MCQPLNGLLLAKTGRARLFWRRMTTSSSAEAIVCKPTRWFLLRAVAMLLMFGVFTVWFYIDASTGYRKKNEEFYLHQAFQQAGQDFSRMNAGGTLTPEEWRTYAAAQSVTFPEDPGVLPADLALPMPWPEILHDYEKVKPLQQNALWLEYSGERGYDERPAEEPFTARKINEQWVVFWICLGLTAATLFFFVRTLMRSIRADEEGVRSQTGKRVPYADLKTLDLRKWDTKGLAFADYEGASGKGRLRIDGLTYGGFKKEEGQPAERLMQRIRSRFSGEIIEYTPVREPAADAAAEEG